MLGSAHFLWMVVVISAGAIAIQLFDCCGACLEPPRVASGAFVLCKVSGWRVVEEEEEKEKHCNESKVFRMKQTAETFDFASERRTIFVEKSVRETPQCTRTRSRFCEARPRTVSDLQDTFLNVRPLGTR